MAAHPVAENLLKSGASSTPAKLFERQMEVYAAYLAYTDHEIGRVIQAVDDMGSSTTR